MADFTFRVKNTPMGVLVVKFYHIEPYRQEAFTQALAREFWFATMPGSGQPWGEAIFQGLVQDNPFLPAFIAQLHTQCPQCNCLRIEGGFDH